MLRPFGWMKKKGQANRLVLITLMVTTALWHAASAYGAVDSERDMDNAKASVSTVAAAALNDIANHWAKGAIETAVQKGYVKGYPDGSFKPSKEVTRAEFVKMVSDSLHLPVEPAAAGTKWYVPYVSALKAAAFLQDGDLGAAWDGKMDRTEMSKLLVRGTDDSVRGKKLTDGEALYKSASAGLIGGIADGTLNEKGTTTRAEAVAVIERLSTVRAGGKLTPDKNAVQNAAILYKGTNLEEVWGTKPVSLPYTLDIKAKVEATLDKMIVVDLDDPKAPLKNKFKNIVRYPADKTVTSGAYVVALHIVLKNAKVQGHTMYTFHTDSVITNSAWQYHFAFDRENQQEFPIVPGVWLDKVSTVSGWYMMVVDKSVIEQHPERKIPMLITFTGNDLLFGKINSELE